MEKAQTKKKKLRLDPLGKQLEDDRLAATRPKDRDRGKGKRREERRVGKPKEFVDAKMSERILRQAREQLDEVRQENEELLRDGGGGGGGADEDEREMVDRQLHSSDSEGGNSDDDMQQEVDAYAELEIDPEDEAAVEAFMNAAAGLNKGPQNLADLVMSKIREAESGQAVPIEELESRFNPKVVEVYRGVGVLMARYHSGKLPKPFKIIPGLNNWEEVLFLTQPDRWSPAGTYQATRIFASNLTPVMAQRFFHLILLPNVRTNIATSATKKLNPHLFNALKKALFKPAAFFRGILLPLAESGDCTLREAAVVGAALAKMTVPAIHASAALLKLCKFTYYNGPTSLFIRVLLNKKYALAFRVIDALVNHFLSFAAEERPLPVLWHQALLAFVQRYKQDVTVEQKNAFRSLLRKKKHHLITAEIRRELFQSTSRDERDRVAGGELDDGDDKMDESN